MGKSDILITASAKTQGPQNGRPPKEHKALRTGKRKNFSLVCPQEKQSIAQGQPAPIASIPPNQNPTYNPDLLIPQQIFNNHKEI